jgi:hypothetical protein
MTAERNEIDSEALGKTLLDIRDFSPEEDFVSFETDYVEEHRPFYCVCKLPIEELAGIHSLEGAGFRFLELQLRLVSKTRERDVSAFPYEFSLVEDEGELEQVLRIAESTFSEDRFSVDPVFGKLDPGVSGRRYRRYIEKSFRAEDERVYKLVGKESGKVVGFNNHKYLGGGEALMFNGGVLNDYKTTGLGAICDYFLINELRRNGIRRFVTHVSARNYPIMNLEIAGLGFRVERTFVVLRKVYGRR